MPNLLAQEDSPYLLQHKNNPINWYPWSKNAFEKAESQNKLIFISIGYSTCHWCHVMEREVFEDEAIAAFMNEHFICIKVDKEERPDIDKHYQDVYQALNHKPGGWPTSIFATPQNRAFFAGTYIPPEPKYNIVGFKHLSALLVEKFQKHDSLIFESADSVEKLLEKEESLASRSELRLEIVEQFIKECKNNFEPTYGGFTVAPKFPQVATLDTLLSVYEFERDETLKSMLIHTLDNMVAGGFYDLVDGGFCRYSVDSEWLVPHFEKMAYDNGLLCQLYVRAFGVLQREYYLEIAKDIAAFIKKFMMQDLFIYSASDADTNAVEGEYFIYTKVEVSNAIQKAGFSKDESKRMTMRLMVSNFGNFEGKNIIHFANTQRETWFEKVRVELQSLRKSREYPFIDKKIQTSWSAMVIEAFFALAVYDQSYEALAESTLQKLLGKVYTDGKLMHASLIEKDAKIEAYLEDYAYLAKALLKAYEILAEEEYLALAKEIIESAIEMYNENGVWKFSSKEFETFADIEDGSYISSVAVMVDVLLTLGTLDN